MRYFIASEILSVISRGFTCAARTCGRTVSVLLLSNVLLSAASWIAPGLQSNAAYSSDVDLFNPGTQFTSVNLEYIPAGSQSGAMASVVSIGPGATLHLSNALQSVFSITDGAGALRISADQALVISARTFSNGSPPGMYSASLPVFSSDQALHAGQTANTSLVAESDTLHTKLSVVLTAPNSSVSITLFDASGTELTTQTISGGPGVSSLQLASVLTSPLPAGSALFSVNSGSAFAYAELSDAVTSDMQVAPARFPLFGSTDLVIAGVTHKSSPDGAKITLTDLRLSNECDAGATVVITPVGFGIDELTPATLRFTANEIKDIRDAALTLFNLRDDATGQLRITSLAPIGVVSRNLVTNSDGSGGTFGDLQPMSKLGAFIAAGNSTTAIGIRADPPPSDNSTSAYMSLLTFSAGSQDAVAGLALSDANGNVVASSDSAITVPAYGYTEQLITNLFPNTAITPGMRVDVNVSSGALGVAHKLLNQTSGDWSTIALSQNAPYVCNPPHVASLTADPTHLDSAGNIELSWSALGADSIQITPLASAVTTATGAQMVVVNGSTTFTLQASNACGSVTQTVLVAVGDPGPTSASSFDGQTTVTSAPPGTLIRLNAPNLADPEHVDGAAFIFPDGVAYAPVLKITDAGELVVRVPILLDSDIPAGYRTGKVPLSLIYGQKFTPAAPFEITPLQYTGDAIADFAALISNLSAYSDLAFSPSNTVPGWETPTAAMKPSANRYLQGLKDLVSSLQSMGSGVLPRDYPSSADPNPEQITIKTQHVQALMALYKTYQSAKNPIAAGTGAVDALRRANATRLSSPHDVTGSHCLIEDPVYAICSGLLLAGALFDPFDEFVDSFYDQLHIDWFLPKEIKSAISTMTKHINMLKYRAQLACHVQPVTIRRDSFRVGDPTPFPGGEEDRLLTPIVTLYPAYTLDDAVNFAVNKYVAYALSRAGKMPKWVSDLFKASPAQQRLNKDVAKLKEELTSLLKPYVDLGSREFRVTKCDLDDVSVLAKSARYIERKPDEDNADLFAFRGHQEGTATLQAITKPGHFIGYQPGGTAVLRFQTDGYLMPLNIGDMPSVKAGYGLTTGTPQTSLVGNWPQVTQIRSYSESFGGASVDVSQVSATRWKLHGLAITTIPGFRNSTGGGITITMPRRSRKTVTITEQVQGAAGDGTTARVWGLSISDGASTDGYSEPFKMSPNFNSTKTFTKAKAKTATANAVLTAEGNAQVTFTATIDIK